MTYPEWVTVNVMALLRELRNEAHEQGVFCLKLVDADGNPCVRLGVYTPMPLQHREVDVSLEREVPSGAGWVFAETYERDASIGGYAEASIEVTGDNVRLLGHQGEQWNMLQRVVNGVQGAASEHAIHWEAAPTRATWRDSDDHYLELIREAIARIGSNPSAVICLTSGAWVTGEGVIDPLAVFASLEQTSRAPRAGLIMQGERALVSASPETFLSIRNGIVRTSPMKGTRRRGATPGEDAELRLELLTSEKERTENMAVTAATCAELATIAAPESVRITESCRVLTYEQVHQMVSDVEARVASHTSLGAVLDATFPGASMTGVPKDWAVRELAELESGRRGLYSGCYGWVSECGTDTQIAMAIRCADVTGDRAYVGAGGGITHASIPATELAEVKLKARAVLEALGARYP